MLCETLTYSSMHSTFGRVQHRAPVRFETRKFPPPSPLHLSQEAVCCSIHSDKVFIASGANVSSIARDSAGKPA